MKKSIADWVWFYWKNGFSIIPLGVNKKNDLKAPSIQQWKPYHHRLPTKEEIQEWLDEELFKNIGVVCGNVSNNLVVIDIDDASIPETIGLNFDKIMKNGSWVAKTGKGYHIYCKHHSNPGSIQKPIQYKIEYRANGGYVAAPPSIHPNGEHYQFLNNGSTTSIDLKSMDVKNIFNQMKEKIGEKWGIKSKQNDFHRYEDNAEEARGYPKCVEVALSTVTVQGSRHDIIYGIASSFSFKDIPIDMAMKRIKQFNLEYCRPPYNNKELETCVESAYVESAKKFGCEFWIDQAQLCPYEKIHECPYGRRKVKRELSSQYGIFKYSEKKDDNTGESFYVKTGVNPTKLAELILNEFDYNFITTDDNKEIYYYNGGRYHSNGDTLIRQLSEEFMEDLTSKHYKNEIEDYIKDKKYVNRFETFNTDPKLINVKNGVVDVTTGELLPHNPSYHFLNEIPVEYDDKADCPLIKKFVSEVVYEKDIPVLQEFMGYCLYRRYNIHKAFMFLGGGKNGKSTFINLLTKFLGYNNVSNKELQDIIYNRFAVSSLYGKLLNASADISDKALGQTGKFKELSGEDRVDAEVKFKDSFTFVNYAKFLFSANKLPAAKDDSYAYFRRWVLISFPNTFVGKQCDPDLLEKITTPSELSGLLNWSIEGLCRLLSNGDFSYSLTVEDVMEKYKTLSDPEYAYVQQNIRNDTNSYIEKDEVWEHYVKWCKENNLPVTPKNMLTTKLSRHIPEMRAERRRILGKRVQVYENISWKEQDTFDDEDDKPRALDDYDMPGYSFDQFEKDLEFYINPGQANQQEETE